MSPIQSLIQIMPLAKAKSITLASMTVRQSSCLIPACLMTIYFAAVILSSQMVLYSSQVGLNTFLIILKVIFTIRTGVEAGSHGFSIPVQTLLGSKVHC
jgi:hypothetical protein